MVEESGQLRGFVVVEPLHAYMAQLFVEVESESRGLGRILLEAASQRMPKGWRLHWRPGILVHVVSMRVAVSLRER